MGHGFRQTEEKGYSDDERMALQPMHSSRLQLPPLDSTALLCDDGFSWDWPLSRPETKARVGMIERHVLLMDRLEMAEEIQRMRSCCSPVSSSASTAASIHNSS